MKANWTQADLDAYIDRQKPPEVKQAEKQARTDKADAGLEKELQAHCENWLALRGYKRRTPEDIVAGEADGRGYFVHMHAAKRNPILLDLLILGSDGRYIEIELKGPNGKPTKEQAKIIMHSPSAFLVNQFYLFCETVERWERMK